MIYLEHIPVEMDECTDLQICVLCGQIISDGQKSEVHNILRGYRPGKPVLKNTTTGSIYYPEDADLFEKGSKIAPCTSILPRSRQTILEPKNQDGNETTS